MVRVRIGGHSIPLAPVQILPGLYNSGPQHWQSLWESANPDFVRVDQDVWDAGAVEGDVCLLISP
jgi:predicted alpha/beta hydrolase family esterase